MSDPDDDDDIDPDDDIAPDTSPWIICGECFGEGKSSAYLGAITQEDRERDWDPDEFERYMEGGYDRICGCCKGAGKVRTKFYENYCEEKADYRSERHHGEY